MANRYGPRAEWWERPVRDTYYAYGKPVELKKPEITVYLTPYLYEKLKYELYLSHSILRDLGYSSCLERSQPVQVLGMMVEVRELSAPFTRHYEVTFRHHERDLNCRWEMLHGSSILPWLVKHRRMFEEEMERELTLRQLRVYQEALMNVPHAYCQDRLMYVTGRDTIKFTQQQKENSTMTTTNTEDHYSKNCAVRTLQQQLERAENNRSSNENSRKAAENDRDFYQRKVECYQAEVEKYEKYERELRSALKKLGAAPAPAAS